MCHITRQCGTSEKCCHVKHGHVFKSLPSAKTKAICCRELTHRARRILTWASDLPRRYAVRFRVNTSLVQRISVYNKPGKKCYNPRSSTGKNKPRPETKITYRKDSCLHQTGCHSEPPAQIFCEAGPSSIVVPKLSLGRLPS